MFSGIELEKVEEIKALLKGNECVDALFLFNQMLVRCEHEKAYRMRFSAYMNTIDNLVCFNALVADFRSLYINDNVFHDISLCLFENLKNLR